MPGEEKGASNPLFKHPLEPFSGLSISDLNRYLPAIHTVEDIQMTQDSMQEGLFLADGREGMAKCPSDSIDLIIVDPPETPWHGPERPDKPITLQEYYQWNEGWLEESYRILKSTGALYLMCDWRLSGMYHALLSNSFKVQTRITWRNESTSDPSELLTWENRLGDIWFATKTDEFMFNQQTARLKDDSSDPAQEPGQKNRTNFWSDIMDLKAGSITRMEGDKPEQLISRMIQASSFKLSRVLDPFMRGGSVGIIAKKLGRRFIGFEIDQDRLLLAMKRIDQG